MSTASTGVAGTRRDQRSAGCRSAPAGAHPQRHTGWVAIGWAELWEYRELLGFLVWRDIKVRYKQTVLGAAWAVPAAAPRR